MLKKFRTINYDYLLVGFYQSIPFGACFTEAFVESVFDYQSNEKNSIVLVYGKIFYLISKFCIEIICEIFWNFDNFFRSCKNGARHRFDSRVPSFATGDEALLQRFLAGQYQKVWFDVRKTFRRIAGNNKKFSTGQHHVVRVGTAKEGTG